MKKLTKILFLLLAMVAIVSAFTVVALAEEEQTNDADGVLIDTVAGTETPFYGYQGFEAAVDTANVAYWNARERYTIVLYNDIVYYKSFTIAQGARIKIDLNGHTLTRINLYGEVYKDGILQGSTTSQPNAFVATKNNFDFALTSAKDGAAFKTVSVNGTAYCDSDGKIISYTASSVSGANTFYASTKIQTTVINITFDNIEIYARTLYTSGVDVNNLNLTVNKCRFYKTVGTDTSDSWPYQAPLRFQGGVEATATISDSLFYVPATTSLYFIEASGNAAITLNNCDIITEHNKFSVRLYAAAQSVTLNNCRIYGMTNYNATYPVTLGPNTVCTDAIASNSSFAEGYSPIASSQTLTYTLPTSGRVTIDENGLPVFPALTSNDYTFTKAVKGYTTVTWLGLNGEVLKTTDAFKNDTAIAPDVKVPTGNKYTALTNPVWINEENGNADLTLGNADTYTFRASTPENPEYVAYATDVLFNMSYANYFTYNLYVPVVDGVENVTIGGNAEPKIVNIDGESYYTAPVAYMVATSSVWEKNYTVSFTVDGISYSITVTISPIIYAELICSDKTGEITDTEKDAVYKLIAYIEQTMSYRYGEGNNKSIFDSFFGEYYDKTNSNSRPANVDYTEDELYTVNQDIYQYVSSIDFALNSQNRLAFRVTLKDTCAGYKVKVAGIANATLAYPTTNDDGTFTYWTMDTSLAKAIMANKYTIAVIDAEGNEVASTDYSLATYGKAVDSPFIDSLYTFGKAVIAVREILEQE